MSETPTAENDVKVTGNHVVVTDGSTWPLPDLADDGLAWRLTYGVALSSAETARAASIIRAYSHLTAEATVAKRSIVVRGIRAALARVLPPAGLCHEFVDTGRCGHSDAEHDALTDAPVPPTKPEETR